MLSNRTLGNYFKFQGLCVDSVRADRQIAVSQNQFAGWAMNNRTSLPQSIPIASAIEIESSIESSLTRPV
jgi:hypothetical protein